MKTLEPTIRRWTRQEFNQMGDLGWFRDRHAELIAGEIIEMAPQKDVHSAGVTLVARALEKVFGPDYWVRSQFPLNLLSHDTEPEPDIAVVKGAVRDYVGTGHPTSALLIVEVSDTTLAFDRATKCSLYAAAGIQDYWILNLLENHLEVYRNPIAAPRTKFGFRYARRTIDQRTDTVTTIARPKTAIAVADLLP